MQIKPGNYCPLIKDECVGIRCAWFTKIAGTDMNTGKEVEEWGCAVAWLPMLLVENAGQSRQTGAAVESFRNEMVKSNERMAKLAVALAQPKQLRHQDAGYGGPGRLFPRSEE